jgi:lysine-N-methylase
MTEQMNTKQQPLLVPQYMRKFACIGSECEDTCCAGWKVTIDEVTFKKYKKCSDIKMKKKLDRSVTRKRSNSNFHNYGEIKMDSNGGCPFLDDNKMCSIQHVLGEEYLSNTCATYPRTLNKIGQIIEVSGTLSCPEIARLVLLNPEIMEFDEIIGSIPNNRAVSNSLQMNQNENLFWELRIFTIEILQNREYSITERLIFLGMFIHKLQQELQEEGMRIIPSIIRVYRSLFQDKEHLKEQFETIPNKLDFQLTICHELIRVRMEAGISHSRYKECVEETIKGLKYNDGLTLDEIVENYKEIISAHFEPFMREHEYILENYLVNYVFKNMFPKKMGNIFNDYVMMIVHFAMIKLHLIGTAGYQQGLTVEGTVKIIQSFARVVEHNASFLNLIHESFVKNELVTMASMAILIKN